MIISGSRQIICSGGARPRPSPSRRNGPAHTPNVLTLDSIRDALIAEAARLDGLDLYDGIDAFKNAFQFNFDPNVPDRVNGYVPLAVIRSLHQLGLVGDPQ